VSPTKRSYNAKDYK
ncbi:conserved hypothetical protein, partial [Trichinella spiralis]